MRILFYFPTSLRANSLSSLMIAFKQMGHEVHFLSHDAKGELQSDIEPAGIITHSLPTNRKGLFFYRWHYKQLKSYIKQHNINLVFSHTQQANIIACFIKPSLTRVIICRHHTDYVFYGNNKNAKRFDSIINKRGKEFIVPAQKTYLQMVENEKVDSKKITIIPYGYDFSQYALPNPIEVEKIKKQYKGSPLLLSIGRMMPEKRHAELLDVMAKIKRADARLIILGDGELRPQLEEKIKILGLQDRVFLPGRKSNVMDYLEACDVLIHTSESETSCSVTKEAALVQKPVVACNEVGDFDEYLKDEKNAIMLPRYDYADKLITLIENYEARQHTLQQMGKQLHADVHALFSIQSVADKYVPYFTK